MKTVAIALVLAFCSASVCHSEDRTTFRWIGSWAASQQIPEPQNAVSADDLRDGTLRQIVHLSLGGQLCVCTCPTLLHDPPARHCCPHCSTGIPFITRHWSWNG